MFEESARHLPGCSAQRLLSEPDQGRHADVGRSACDFIAQGTFFPQTLSSTWKNEQEKKKKKKLEKLMKLVNGSRI